MLALALGLLLTTSVVASASTITYIHSGFGSGTLDGQSFGDLAPVPFTITAIGDTDNITSCSFDCLTNTNTSASITIGGLGTFDFVTGTRYFSNSGIVGFSRASGGDLFNGPDLVWDMTTSVGPIVGTALLLQWTGLEDIVTSGGILVFNNAETSATFTAIVGPTGAVPEPATLLLLGTGLGAVAARRRLARRRC